ncbi:MAG: hypothetical protein K9N23_11760 [Akkermansiaceae bacterium]|nr:hypothetical protein [Akkermansiaceae bacterium]
MTPKPTPGRDRNDKALLDELEEVIFHDRAVEILDNGWLHDRSLPIPSPNLTQYLAFRLLAGHGIKIEAAEAATRNAIIEAVVGAFKKESAKERIESIRRTMERLKCYRLLQAGADDKYPNHYDHEWSAVLWAFLYPPMPGIDPESTSLSAGTRMLARGILESMMLQAAFNMNPGRFESLARVIRRMNTKDGSKPIRINLRVL